MEWRCAWCGKPHEENDPPCDNCGHGEFEKAVVPMAPESEDDDGDTITVWVCAECGNDHHKHTPPCDRCGGGPLERREVDYDEEAVMAEMLGDDEGGRSPSADVSYLDVLDTKLVLGFVGVGLLVVVLALGFMGIVNVPGIPNDGGPVPGNATTYQGLSLSTVEAEYVSELNARRAANGDANLTRDQQLSSAATSFNQDRVRAEYADGEGANSKAVARRVDDACGDADPASVIFAVEAGQGQDASQRFDSERAMAQALVSAYRNSPDAPESFANTSNGIVGVDVHVAPDGRIYVTQFAC